LGADILCSVAIIILSAYPLANCSYRDMLNGSEAGHPLSGQLHLHILQQIQQRIRGQEYDVSHSALHYESRAHRLLESPNPSAIITEVESWRILFDLRWTTPSGIILNLATVDHCNSSPFTKASFDQFCPNQRKNPICSLAIITLLLTIFHDLVIGKSLFH
jgi:hypothetical protein